MKEKSINGVAEESDQSEDTQVEDTEKDVWIQRIAWRSQFMREMRGKILIA